MGNLIYRSADLLICTLISSALKGRNIPAQGVSPGFRSTPGVHQG